MARQFLFLNPPVTSMDHAGLGAMTLLLCAFALFMCASHSRGWHRRRGCYRFSNDNIAIQHNAEATILTTNRIHRVQPGDDEGMVSGEQVSVWQKNILMGEKCQLPDYSGIIVYDSAGNLVPPAKTSRVTLSLQ